MNFLRDKMDSESFSTLVEKIIARYESREYRDKFLDKGKEPPETLYWLLLDYASRYGRDCAVDGTMAEWRNYGNSFTTELYFCDGYYFNRMDGQGSIVRIIKESQLSE